MQIGIQSNAKNFKFMRYNLIQNRINVLIRLLTI